MKPGTLMAYREQGKVPVPSPSCFVCLRGPPLLRRRHRMKPTRERGRPARTSPGTASAISSTRVDRPGLWDSASAEPMALPPAGRPGAASQETERQATGWHAGGTPALPGGASSHRSCSSRGHAPACRAAARADAAVPSRLAAPCVTPWITLFSFVSNKFRPMPSMGEEARPSGPLPVFVHVLPHLAEHEA